MCKLIRKREIQMDQKWHSHGFSVKEALNINEIDYEYGH